MGIKVYYSEISAQKEVKKRQQKVMMILESKLIPYEAIDITEPGKESCKDFMLSNAKPRGDSKCVVSPQVFNEDTYCGDYDDFELANENDELEQFLSVEKVVNNNKPAVSNGNQNGGSRESSAEVEAGKTSTTEADIIPVPATESEEIPPPPVEETEEEPMSTTEEDVAKPSGEAEEEGIEQVQEIVAEEEED